jgi:hypothetical protein
LNQNRAPGFCFDAFSSREPASTSLENAILGIGNELRAWRTGDMMANTATIRNANGLPATFVGSKTGQDDAPFVFIKVGDEERRMRWAEWDALPAWTGPRPARAARE